MLKTQQQFNYFDLNKIDADRSVDFAIYHSILYL